MESKKDIIFFIFHVVPQLARGSCLYDFPGIIQMYIWHTISERRPMKSCQRIPWLETSHDHGFEGCHSRCRNYLILVSHEYIVCRQNMQAFKLTTYPYLTDLFAIMQIVLWSSIIWQKTSWSPITKTVNMMPSTLSWTLSSKQKTSRPGWTISILVSKCLANLLLVIC